MKSIVLFLKGIIVGMGQIIPGISGGMLAISMGIYDKCIEIISNIFKDFKNNVKYILPIFLGIVTSILIISKLIKSVLDLYYVPTMLLFIGLILGTLKSTFKNIDYKKDKKHTLITIFIIIILTLLSLVKTNNVSYDIDINLWNILMLIFVGFVYAFATVVPGISATALMVMLGYYSLIIDVISNLTNINFIVSHITILIPLAIGLISGVFIVSKLMNYLFKKQEKLTNYIILGLLISSIISMFIDVFSNNYNILSLIIGFILMIIGYFISKLFDK